jgi:hypothetical protein
MSPKPSNHALEPIPNLVCATIRSCSSWACRIPAWLAGFRMSCTRSVTSSTPCQWLIPWKFGSKTNSWGQIAALVSECQRCEDSERLAITPVRKNNGPRRFNNYAVKSLAAGTTEDTEDRQKTKEATARHIAGIRISPLFANLWV